jgi:tetratricopeptide (TPR) repeat protein
MGMTLVTLTDYDAELERVEKDITDLGPTALVLPVQSELATKYLYRLYQHVSLTGNLQGLASIEKNIDRAIEQLGPAEDLCLLKANLNFKLHRLPETKQALQMAPALSGRAEGRSLLADIGFQSGRYVEARQAIEALIEEDRTWDNLARLAHMRLKMGDFAAADRLYLEAEDELTAKEMRSYAWVEVQRGLGAAMRGEHELALQHLTRADNAYSGFWMIQEYIGDIYAAQGDQQRAVVVYEEVLQQVRKPELLQKAGEIYAKSGQPEKAERLLDEALAIYLKSAEQGEVHYYHHLVEFYAAARLKPEECLKWASLDAALRDNFATQSALAWALYLNGQTAEAARKITQALESGAQDAGIFSKAADIYEAAGMHAESHQCEHKAHALNRHHATFHVHL